eukprot:4008144-Ditylum_brightwellii.AAC.1
MMPTAQQGGMNNNMPIFQMPQSPMVPHIYNPNMMGVQYQQFPQMMGALQHNFPRQNFVTQQQQGHSGIPGAK